MKKLIKVLSLVLVLVMVLVPVVSLANGSFDGVKDIDTLRSNLISVSEDGTIREDEREAFQGILDSLEKISINANALRLWAIKNIKY